MGRSAPALDRARASRPGADRRRRLPRGPAAAPTISRRRVPAVREHDRDPEPAARRSLRADASSRCDRAVGGGAQTQRGSRVDTAIDRMGAVVGVSTRAAHSCPSSSGPCLGSTPACSSSPGATHHCCRRRWPPGTRRSCVRTGRSRAVRPWCVRQTMRRSEAQRASSWRFESCSLRRTAETCASTVFTEIVSSCAISL